MGEQYFAELLKNREESLEHHGVLGQKWGVRRFQDKSGHITAEGKARYRRDKVLNNVGRAVTNTSLGQRLAVNLNKGYREDKKEIKGLYKQKKTEIGNDKEKQKSLKDDYKKTLGEARTTAAQVNYGWQSDEANKKIQTQSVGKAFLKSMLMGGTGTMLYDNLSSEPAASKGASAVLGFLGGQADYYTGGAVSLGNYVYGKYKTSKVEGAANSKKKVTDGYDEESSAKAAAKKAGLDQGDNWKVYRDAQRGDKKSQEVVAKWENDKKQSKPSAIMVTKDEAKKLGLDDSTRFTPEEESEFWKAYAAQIEREQKKK